MNITTFEQDKQSYSLPPGFTARPATLDDVEITVELLNKVTAQKSGTEQWGSSVLRAEWTGESLKIATDTRLAFAPDGELVGYVEAWAPKTPVKTEAWLRVLPAYAETVGAYLLRWAEARARQRIAACPPDVQVLFMSSVKTADESDVALRKSLGLEPMRYAHLMRIDLDAPPELPPLPEGISVRTYRHPEDLAAVVEADIEGFRDHWGFVEPVLEEEIEEWRHRFDTDDIFDPRPMLLAIDDATGNIAALALARQERWSDPSVAYVYTLMTLKPYRRRGLGLALLLRNFKVLYDMGHPNIVLHVDTESLTGATRLYEKAGMHIHETYVDYAKELRPGKPAMTVDLDTNPENEESE